MTLRKSATGPAGRGDAKTAWMRTGASCMLEIGPDGSLKDIVTDGKGSVVATGDTGGLKIRGYMAYGYAPSTDSTQSALGYNGEYTDPVTGNYHLGNGYRAFSPTLNRFTAPDSLSPFGAGDLNTYAYCAGDPINAIDPTGHMKWWQLGLIAVSVVSLASIAFDGFEILAAAGAVLKFAQIGEDAAAVEGAGEIAATAARLSTANKVWHGIFALKNVGSSVLQGAIDYETIVKKNSLIVNGHPSTLGYLQFANLAAVATNFADFANGAYAWSRASSLKGELNGLRGGDVEMDELSVHGAADAGEAAAIRQPAPSTSGSSGIFDADSVHSIPQSVRGRAPRSGVGFSEVRTRHIEPEGLQRPTPPRRSTRIASPRTVRAAAPDGSGIPTTSTMTSRAVAPGDWQFSRANPAYNPSPIRIPRVSRFDAFHSRRDQRYY
jgi:RHS repeat-associated protein